MGEAQRKVLGGKRGTAVSQAPHTALAPPRVSPSPAAHPRQPAGLLARRPWPAPLWQAPRSEPTPPLQSLAYIPAAKPWL